MTHYVRLFRSVSFFTFPLITLLAHAQRECQIVYETTFKVQNNHTDTLVLHIVTKPIFGMSLLDQEFFVLPPGQTTVLGNVGWAEEFRNPAPMFTMTIIGAQNSRNLNTAS
jgi:hypothetical protein